MKITKKVLAMFLVAILALSMVACSSGESKPQDTSNQDIEEGNEVENAPEDEEPAIGSDVSATLRIAGPGLFTSVGETGTVDLISGVERPGYEVIIQRWNELYPNVKLEIEPSPWDNWKAVLQTSALSGEVDVLLHGASITAIAEPVGPYLDAEPGLTDLFSMIPMRRTEDNGGDFSKYIPYGLTITANPVVVVIDKQIFENYGVEVPTADWTFDDVLSLAEQTTGVDPVTGNQTYGISMLGAASANKNYIWTSRGFNAPVFDFQPTLAETKGDFTKDATKDVLNYINELYTFSSPDYLEGLDIAVANTEDNNLAMLISESPLDVYNKLEESDLLDRFMFMALPKIESGDEEGITSSHMGDWNMAICNTSENKDLAWEFIKFMVTDEVALQWITDAGAIANNLSALTLLEENIKPDYFNAIKTILEEQPLEFSASTNVHYDSGNFGSFANDITIVLNEMFVGNETADSAVLFVQKNLDEYLDSMK